MIDNPNTPNHTEAPAEKPTRVIDWCQGHWAEMVRALEDRGLEGEISIDQDELSAKFMQGEVDPLWEACQMVNVGALQIFGPDKILEDNAGCPLCAFANMSQHIADVMVTKYRKTH